jgi:hypothetical protein
MGVICRYSVSGKLKAILSQSLLNRYVYNDDDWIKRLGCMKHLVVTFVQRNFSYSYLDSIAILYIHVRQYVNTHVNKCSNT